MRKSCAIQDFHCHLFLVNRHYCRYRLIVNVVVFILHAAADLKRILLIIRSEIWLENADGFCLTFLKKIYRSRALESRNWVKSRTGDFFILKMKDQVYLYVLSKNVLEKVPSFAKSLELWCLGSFSNYVVKQKWLGVSGKSKGGHVAKGR